MLSSSFFRALCIGATLVTVSGQSLFQNLFQNIFRNRFQNQCWTCDQSPGCFECRSRSDNGDGTATVELDFSECKNDDISWACCTGSSGPDNEFNRGACEVPGLGCVANTDMTSDPEAGSPKCEGVSAMFVVVPADATAVTINTHDGRTGNDAFPAVGADPICAGQGYQGGRCTTRDNLITSHCLETIDLSTCPPVVSDPPSAVPTSLASDPPSGVPTFSENLESDAPSAVPTQTN